MNAVMHKVSSGVSRLIRVVRKHPLHFLTLYTYLLKIKAIIGLYFYQVNMHVSFCITLSLFKAS